MVQLTEFMVLSKSRSDSLNAVKNLNLWGNDLTDVSILERMPNVEVLSLSVNRISSLKDFHFCPKLSELYLRKNMVNDIQELRYLQKLKNLKVLWLHENPCANLHNYRLIVIKAIPNLTKLDNTDISADERALALGSDVPTVAPVSDVPLKQEAQFDTPRLPPDAPKPDISHSRFSNPPSRGSAPTEGEVDRRTAHGTRASWAGDGKMQVQIPKSRVKAEDQSAPRGRPSWGNPQAQEVRESIRAAAMRDTMNGPENEKQKDPFTEDTAADKLQSLLHEKEKEKKVDRTKDTHSNVLYAVLALLNDLDEDKLHIVKAEVESKLKHKRQ